jgi:hypothetical protein
MSTIKYKYFVASLTGGAAMEQPPLRRRAWAVQKRTNWLGTN